jgi:hypothetical protein
MRTQLKGILKQLLVNILHLNSSKAKLNHNMRRLLRIQQFLLHLKICLMQAPLKRTFQNKYRLTKKKSNLQLLDKIKMQLIQKTPLLLEDSTDMSQYTRSLTFHHLKMHLALTACKVSPPKM